MFFSHARSHQTPGEDATIVAFLKACTKQKDVHTGGKVHAHILERGSLQKNVVIGNTLVHMYAQCGALPEAQQVFSKLATNRDIVSWNTLAMGYTQHGHSEVALNLFERMQHEAISPDAVTFACILKACGNIPTVENGKRLHACMSESLGKLRTTGKGKESKKKSTVKVALADSAALKSALLDMYAKCGALAIAQQVFDELPTRDMVAWTALMAGYCQQGQGEEALDCFEQMQEEGIAPDSVTFTCVLKACGSIGALEKGQEIHHEIMRRQLHRKDTILSSALIDMYAKCGVLAIAQEIFDSLPVKDLIAWTALLEGYCQHRQGEEVLRLFDMMKHKGLPFDAVTFSCILKACANIGALEKGEELHAEILKKGLLGKGSMLDGALLDMYVKCGALGKSQRVFEELVMHDLVSWTILLTGFGEQGLGESALHYFKQLQGEGLSADAITFAGILKFCGSLKAIEMGKVIHAEIARRQCLEKDVVLGSALVDMYAKCGLLQKAQQIFDTLRDRDVVSWTALIFGYCEHGQGEKALECFERLKLEGLSPSVVTFACMLKTCGSIGAARKGTELCAKVMHKELSNSAVLGNAVLDTYAKWGAFGKTKQVFDELPIRDVVTWNGMITRCLENELVEKTMECYERMNCEGVSPDALTFARILRACGSAGAIEKGKQIHSEMVKKGLLENDVVLGNALVEMYAKCCAIGKAQQEFNKLTVRDVVSWNVLMTGYCEHGLTKQAFHCLKNMEDSGIPPDAVTFACVLKTCGSIGAATNSEMYFELMRSRYGIIPNVEHQTCMVGLLGRAGLFDKAVSMSTKISALDYPPTWSALLDACQSCGNVVVGQLAFEHAARVI